MNYIKEDGLNKHVIVTLHGTGGSARDLFPLAKSLDPEATLIGFQGQVIENGMRRFFARFPDGSFDLESLKKGSEALYEDIINVIERYQLEDYKITLMGYSNGANIIKDLLKEYQMPEISKVLLFHPSPITPDKAFKEQKDLHLFMTWGKQDPYMSHAQFKEMKAQIIQAEISLNAFIHEEGHQITPSEIKAAKEFLQGRLNE